MSLLPSQEEPNEVLHCRLLLSRFPSRVEPNWAPQFADQTGNALSPAINNKPSLLDEIEIALLSGQFGYCLVSNLVCDALTGSIKLGPTLCNSRTRALEFEFGHLVSDTFPPFFGFNLNSAIDHRKASFFCLQTPTLVFGLASPIFDSGIASFTEVMSLSKTMGTSSLSLALPSSLIFSIATSFATPPLLDDNSE